MKDKELKPNANAVGAFIGSPHFGRNATDSPTPNSNSNSKIRALTSNHKGITLIALIITIIVMLILAGVTINVAINGGLFSTAKDAVGRTQIEKEKEQIMAGYSAYQIASVQGEEANLGVEVVGATVTGNEQDGWTIIFDETGNTYKLYPDGRIEKIEEEPAELTDIYVTLYTDGTLGFSNNQDKIEEKEVSQDYENIKGQTFNYSNKAPWYADKDNITTVEIQNEIVPNETTYWFYQCGNLTKINNIANLNTSNVTDMHYMFFECSSLKTLDLSSFDTGNVENMSYLLHSCTNLEELNIKNFKTNKVTNMWGMFYGCKGLKELDLTDFNTNNAKTMFAMFTDCENLIKLDLSSFDTEYVENMGQMFTSCSNLTELDLSSFDTKNVTNMSSMFSGCTSLKLVYGNKDRWNTDNVTDYGDMWNNCGTNYITYKTYLEGDKLVGYEIGENYGWSGTNTVTRSYNNKRASSKHVIQLDPEKKYEIRINNQNYYYGCNIVDLDSDLVKENKWKLKKDNLWNEPSKTLTITDAKYAVLNFKYRNEPIITPEMVDEINQAFEIRVVE